MPTPIELVSGLAGAIGCDFRQSNNQLVFVEYGGKLSTYDIFPAATIMSQGSAILKGTFLFDLDTGTESAPGLPVGTGWDIFWEAVTSVVREMRIYDSTRIVNIGVVPFASVTPSGLQSLPYGTTPINGNDDPTNKLVVGDVFAVKTTNGNYAKVLITSYGYNLGIQWVTYRLNPAYHVIGTGYTNPESVVVSGDNTHAYITERSGDLVKVSLTAANRASASVIASGLVAPQQLALDEAHNNAYVVEYDPAGHGNLYRISLVAPFVKQSIVSNLAGAVGLALSSDLQFAYVSEQNTGSVSRITLANGSRQQLVSGLTAPFHLTWADSGQSGLFLAERDPANRITRISLSGSSASSNVLVSGVASRPSSVALANPSTLLICCNSDLQSCSISPFAATGPLLMGIGFIPFDKVVPATGLANTTVDPHLPLQVLNVPFGGTLPLMVNHATAYANGAAFYRVLVYKDAALTMLELVDTAPVSDEKWNGTTYADVTTNTVTIAGKPGYLPVHPLSDLPLWYTPTLGAFLDSTVLPNGKNTIVIEFVTATGAAVATTPGLTILVDNNPCSASLGQPTLGGSAADTVCGLLHYSGKTPPQVVMPFTASHPNGYATYSLSLIKGVNTLTPPSVSGPVSSAVSPIIGGVSTLLGTCTIAGFAEYLYVAASATNGWGRQSEYDASAAIAFVLAP